MRVLKAFLLISIMITGVFAADSVETLTFQGRLTGSDGQPVDGVRNMSYVLENTAGTEIFEWYTSDQQTGLAAPNIDDLGSPIPIYRGIYAISLPFEKDVLQNALKNNDELYIRVYVEYPQDPDPGIWETLDPRIKVASSMFSMMANQVKWAKADDPTSGNLGIRYDDDSSVGIGREPIGTAKVAIHNRDLDNALSVEGDVVISAGSTPASNPGNLTVANSGTFGGNMNVTGTGTFGDDVDVGAILLEHSTGYITATRVYDAVWNDLAEFRPVAKDTEKKPGKAYLSTKEGLKIPDKRCQAGVVGIYSDTYGFSLGGTEEDKNKIPIAISGWTLAYVDKDYPIGTALVNDKGGILTKASFWEKVKYPERILAVIDHGPEEYNDLEIDGRIWVKVK